MTEADLRECPIPEAVQIASRNGVCVYVSWAFSADEHPLWSHWCPKRQAWENMHTPNHIVASREPLTLTGSLICEGCHLHGFIREGRWVAA